MDVAKVRKVGVIGAGQMGRGIAQVAAAGGYEVTLSDADLPRAEAAKASIGKALGRLVDKGKLEASDRDAQLARITPVADATSHGAVDIAIEAVSEEPSLKLAVLRAVDAALPEAAVLATNTSSISVTRLAAATKRPDRFVGMHFMNPVPLMQLVEVVRGLSTSEATLTGTVALAQKLGKTTIVSNDAPRFLVNRILIPLLNEACFALEGGVGSAADIDTGARLGLNHPMGPLELADLIGLDTVLAIAEVLQRDLGDPKYRPATILRNHVAAGWLGRKTRRGFYAYDEAGKKIES